MNDFRLTEEEVKKLFTREHPGSEGAPKGSVSSPPFPSQPRPSTPTPKGQRVKEEPGAPSALPSPFHKVPYQSPPPESVRSASLPPARSTEHYHSRSRRLIRSLGMFLISFFLGFAFVNSGTFTSRVGYWWKTDIRGDEVDAATVLLPALTPPSPPSPHPPSAPPPTVLPPSPPPAAPSGTASNRLSIPKIGVDAPIVWNADPANILSDLQKGVAHYVGTALPNMREGNVFITGHSSNFVWDRSPYNHIFANLDKLVAGDLIGLTYEGTRYVYRVKGSVVVRPQEVEVLAQTTDPTLSLMTCTPVGTNLRRLIVRADLIRATPL
jgi:LPXTG-site transpeptidase (sortase) family protein